MKAIPRVPLMLALAGAGAFFIVKAWIYIVSPAPPFAYYYDLGVNAIATNYMVHAFASWKDFSDNLGWVAYGDVPNFYFNPELSYLTLVPLAKLFGDVWFTIKSVQVLQEVVALLGAALLYATFIKGRIWAVVAGTLYATLPATALEIRGNVDIGWAIALTPLALAASLRLVRRFGAVALPLCGVILSVCGFCFAVEYVFFTTLPAFAFVVFYVLPSGGRLKTLAFALLGFCCIFGMGGYFILPTLGGRHYFTDPAARTAVLQSGTQLDLFSQSWYGLLALLPREFLISDYPQFNAVTRLGGLLPATVLLWIAAASTVVGGIRKNVSRTRYAALAAVSGLLLLALGSNVPFGTQLWAVLRVLPGLALVRTPDRFLALPLVLIVIAAVAALARLARHRSLVARSVAFAVVALSIALFFQFDFAEHWLVNEDNVASLEPDLSLVNERAAAQGGRTLSYAVVRGGSEFYTPSYGVPTPTLWYFWDIASHYRDDGLQGYGIFRRANVHSVIATPDWSANVDLPISSEIDNDFPGTPVVATGDGVIVKRIGARAPVGEMTAACTYGGPGLLDAASALPALDALTFVARAQTCTRAVFLDYDPGPSGFIRRTTGADAATLFPTLPALLDADYSFDIGRTFINDAWYRNSIDGDDALSQGGARLITSPVNVAVPLASPVQEDQTFELRLAVRRAARITLGAPDGRTAAIDVVPRAGLRWYAIPLRHLSGAHELALRIHVCEDPAACTHLPWDGIAFDRMSIVAGRAPDFGHPQPAAAALFSIANLTTDTSSDSNAGAAGADAIALSPSASHGIFRQPLAQEPYVAADGNGSLQYRWSGPPGDYLIAASGRLRGPGATLSLAAGAGAAHCCRATSAYDAAPPQNEAVIEWPQRADLTRERRATTGVVSHDVPSPRAEDSVQQGSHVTDVLLRTHLVHGSPLTVSLAYPQLTRDAGASLSSLTVSPTLPRPPERRSRAGRQGFALDAVDLSRTLSAVRDVEFGTGRILGTDGAFIEHRFSVTADAESAVLRVSTEGHGDATATLDCDGYSAKRSISSPVTYVAVGGRQLRNCRTRIDWMRGALAVTSLDLDFIGDRMPDVRALVWLPRGKFSIVTLQSGARLRAASIVVDGRSPGRTIDLGSSGYHRIVLRGVSARDRALAFVSTALPSARSSGLQARQLSTFDWRARLTETGALEIASYPDGNWRLDSLEGRHVRADAIRCDLIQTCFTNVAPGLYRLHHVWPASLRTGMLVTLLALAAALLPLVLARLVIPYRKRRSTAAVRAA